MDIEQTISEFNEKLSVYGLLPLALISPKSCLGQRKNARYFMPEKFKQLVENIKQTGALESVPLVYPCEEQKGKYMIISGHHRVEAAKEAGIENILVMLANYNDNDDIVSKQLSHNALVGQDDKVVLAELFNSIQSTVKKISTGLANEISKINYTSLNFKVGTFKQFTILFLPEDIGLFEETMEDIENNCIIKNDGQVQLAELNIYDKFKKSIIKIKKIENIKSNAVAFSRLVELATEKMQEILIKNEVQ